MPMLFLLGQHAALQAVQDACLTGEHLFAHLDDIYVVCLSERVTTIHKLFEQSLEQMPEFKCIWALLRCGTAVVMSFQGVMHCRRPQSAWIRMPGCGRRVPKPRARIRVLGIPAGHDEFVQAQLVHPVCSGLV